MPRTSFTSAAVLLFLGIILCACGDSVTGPGTPGHTAPTKASSGSSPSNVFGVKRGDPRFMCYVSKANDALPGMYNHGRRTVRLPLSAVAPDGSTQLYRYRIIEPGAAPDAKPIAAGNCRIPNTPRAVEFMDKRLGLDSRRRRSSASQGGDGLVSTQDCVRDGTCVLPGIIVIGYPTAPSWPGGGSGGGGGWDASVSYYDPGPTPEWDPGLPEEPCKTGDPLLDDPVVNEGFARLWEASNVTAAAWGDRIEQYGWIVRTPTGYRIEHIGSGNVCGADFDPVEPAEGYGAIIGFIHTHPYGRGEAVASCGSDGRITGYQEYPGGASDFDREASVTLGKFLWGPDGPALGGMILDANGMTVFDGWDKLKDIPIARCGY